MTSRRRRKNNGLGCLVVIVALFALGALGALVQAFTQAVGAGDFAAAAGPAFLLLLLVGSAVGVPVAVYVWRWHRRHDAEVRYDAMRRNTDLNQVDYMSGVEFEQWLAVVFRDFGYRVEMTKVVGDYGGDLVLAQGPLRIVVQAKRYSGRVGQDAVRQAVASRGVYHASIAAVATNSYFTPHATTLARANGVYLLDRSALHRLIEARWRRTTVPVHLLPGLPLALETRGDTAGKPCAGYLRNWIERIGLSKEEASQQNPSN